MICRRGALIVFEGGDRVGKTTQVTRLFEQLQRNGVKVEHMRFPDRSTEIGTVINKYLSSDSQLSDQCIHLLFSANRWEFEQEILRKLHNGTTLIVDRYAFSGAAYTAAKGLSLHWCCQPDVGMPRPDRVFYLHAPAAAIRQRRGYGEERYERDEMQSKVVACYDMLFEADRWTKIDATLNEQTIHELLLAETSQVIATSGDQPVDKLWTPSLPGSVQCTKQTSGDMSNVTSVDWLKTPATIILISICLSLFFKFFM